MFKKITVLLLVFNFLTLPAFAEKQEWVDKNFDFSKAKKIYCANYIPDVLANGIVEHEINDIVCEKFDSKIVNKLTPYKYEFYSIEDIIDEIKEKQGTDLNILGKMDPEAANATISQYLNENFDLAFLSYVQVYGTASQYVQGHYMETPSTQTSQVITPNGVGTVYTQGTTKTYIPGGYAAKPCAVVRFEVINIKTDNAVWVRIDDRAKVNTIVDNTKPKDILSRIVSSFYGDFSSRLIKDCKKEK